MLHAEIPVSVFLAGFLPVKAAVLRIESEVRVSRIAVDLHGIKGKLWRDCVFTVRVLDRINEKFSFLLNPKTKRS
jgi:hypothetical protein